MDLNYQGYKRNALFPGSETKKHKRVTQSTIAADRNTAADTVNIANNFTIHSGETFNPTGSLEDEVSLRSRRIIQEHLRDSSVDAEVVFDASVSLQFFMPLESTLCTYLHNSREATRIRGTSRLWRTNK